MDKLLKEYAEIDEKMRILDEVKQLMRVEILKTLQKQKLEKVESTWGRFTRSRKTTWKYSSKITTAEEKLKIAKVKEQEKGIAKPDVSEYLLFSKPKKNGDE